MNIFRLSRLPQLFLAVAASFLHIHASEVELYFTTQRNGDGETSFNMTSKNDVGEMEVDHPIFRKWGNGSVTGDVWGGGSLGEFKFTNVEILDYTGESGTLASINGNVMGLGIKSDSGGHDWMIDGKESFTIMANSNYEFRGFTLRKGSRLGDNCQLAISSPSWKNFNHLVDSSELGLGVSFTIENGKGVFILTADKNVYEIHDILGDLSEVVSLHVGPGNTLTFDNYLDGKEGFSLSSMVIKQGYVTNSMSPVLGVGGISLDMGNK